MKVEVSGVYWVNRLWNRLVDKQRQIFKKLVHCTLQKLVPIRKRDPRRNEPFVVNKGGQGKYLIKDYSIQSGKG